MTTPPPTVPGMPEANSSPVSPCSRAARAAWAMDAPAWATNRFPSTVMRLIPGPTWATTPLYPSSSTSRLLPFPTTKNGTPAISRYRLTFFSCSSLSNCRKQSAGPPIRKVVWPAIGSCKWIFSSGTNFCNASTTAFPIISETFLSPPRDPAAQEGAEKHLPAALSIPWRHRRKSPAAP